MNGLPVADRPAVRRAMRGILASERRAVTLVLVLRAAAAVAGLAVPWLVGDIVNSSRRRGGIGPVLVSFIVSADRGVTWSKPRSIDDQLPMTLFRASSTSPIAARFRPGRRAPPAEPASSMR